MWPLGVPPSLSTVSLHIFNNSYRSSGTYWWTKILIAWTQVKIHTPGLISSEINVICSRIQKIQLQCMISRN